MALRCTFMRSQVICLSFLVSTSFLRIFIRLAYLIFSQFLNRMKDTHCLAGPFWLGIRGRLRIHLVPYVIIHRVFHFRPVAVAVLYGFWRFSRTDFFSYHLSRLSFSRGILLQSWLQNTLFPSLLGVVWKRLTQLCVNRVELHLQLATPGNIHLCCQRRLLLILMVLQSKDFLLSTLQPEEIWTVQLNSVPVFVRSHRLLLWLSSCLILSSMKP